MFIKNKLMFFAIVIFSSCTNNPKDDSKSESLALSKQQTSDALASIPAKFTGTIASNYCDSIALELDLSSNEQEYVLMIKQYGIAGDQRDSVDYQNGKWNIEGADELILLTEATNRQYSRFKIISGKNIMLLDSTGSEKTDGKNYTLNLSSSVAQ